MGTSFSVVLQYAASQKEMDSLRRQVEAELDRLENIFSTYRTDSEISRLNRNYHPRQPYHVSPDMAAVLRIAAGVRKSTGGAFSPLVGALVEYWGFGPGKQTPRSRAAVPPATLLCSAQADFSGGGDPAFLRVVVQESGSSGACNGHRPKLDLSAIAKGYAVDRLVQLLNLHGFVTYMIEIGGEICVRSGPGAVSWRIGIENPLRSGGIAEILTLENGCVATSGNGRQGRVEKGAWLTHIIDPRTGLPLQRKLSSVSVIALSAAEADAWATGLYVLGAQKAIELAAEQSLAVLYLDDAGGRLKRQTSPAWPGG